MVSSFGNKNKPWLSSRPNFYFHKLYEAKDDPLHRLGKAH